MLLIIKVQRFTRRGSVAGVRRMRCMRKRSRLYLLPVEGVDGLDSENPFGKNQAVVCEMHRSKSAIRGIVYQGNLPAGNPSWHAMRDWGECTEGRSP